ncbi:MAG: glycoside hydrolase family 2 TIM barrel-domain containing protein [Eubacteriales bacterium]|nr:glycoside hydrolase family 2 TIM barrel-domain containing protein [Eubacteriales bacterium]
MAAEDFFQEIAMTKHPVGDSDKEVEPREACRSFFEETDTFPEGIAFSQDVPFEEKRKAFRRQLEDMRAQYRPFMENYLPEANPLHGCLELRQFEFRYLKKHEIFSNRYEEEEEWEAVEIPDYRGPAEENGRWRGYYRTWFDEVAHEADERIILRFQCVDYIAKVYLNGNFVGSHEGFFAPFEFDITDYLEQDNELYIECINDLPTLGIGAVLDGDKLYGATGPGWDDPRTGWHHCPAGAGIFGKVTVECRPEIFVTDIFVRPDIDSEYSEIRIGVQNYTEEVKEGCMLEIHALPRNFQGEEIGSLTAKADYIGVGKNEYRYKIRLTGYRLWEPDTPWLYGAAVKLTCGEDVISQRVTAFGMKKFVSDESVSPKGKFYLNNKPCILRGANEMGHLQQCVMKGDMDQLVDDILIAKMCHMNYYRMTQRPVQEEIYEYFDMLGIFHQCDFPLFGFLRRNQFAEAVRQTVEMEHLIRSHVSSVMVTFINEPMCIRKTNDPNDKYSKRYAVKGHRNLLRDELEAFFAAARKAIYTENPDRVIKNVEGDYDAPTKEGMPDFHTYTMWYSNHGEPIGRLLKGYLPPIKSGWMAGCGEYGAEGLDNLPVMEKYYPKEWMEKREDGSWFPDRIVRAQTHSVQGDWYQEQETVEDWIRESQIHQAHATRLMTDAFRRRADVINHTAIHLLIDAWPSGWMKTLLDCEREPKRAYFAYQDCLVPLRAHLWCDRNYAYAGERISVESWLLNDTGEERTVHVCAAVRVNGRIVSCWEKEARIEAAYAKCVGLIPVTAPQVETETAVRVEICILDADGVCLNAEKWEFLAYPRVCGQEPVAVIGKQAAVYARAIGLEAAQDADAAECDAVLVSDYSAESLAKVQQLHACGKKLVLLLPDEPGFETEVCGLEIGLKKCPEVFFAAAEEEDRKYHLNMLYNRDADYIDFVGRNSIVCQGGRDVVYSYAKNGFVGSAGRKPRLPFVKVFEEEGIVMVSLLMEGRVGVNPNLDALVADLVR